MYEIGERVDNDEKDEQKIASSSNFKCVNDGTM